MFGWQKKEPKAAGDEKKTRALINGALDAASKFGDLLQEMERDSVLVYDIAKLPLPKSQMKTALKIAWTVAPNDHFRNAVEIAFASLSSFQEGVGSTPICHTTLPSLKRNREQPNKEALLYDIRQNLPQMERELSWMNKQLAEMTALTTEFDQFKRQQAEIR